MALMFIGNSTELTFDDVASVILIRLFQPPQCELVGQFHSNRRSEQIQGNLSICIPFNVDTCGWKWRGYVGRHDAELLLPPLYAKTLWLLTQTATFH